MTKTEHQRLLERFWVATSTVDDHEGRIALLQQLASLPVIKPIHRDDRLKPETPIAKCWACGSSTSERYEWHHLIPVKCGGRSTPFNFIGLCWSCHQRAHAGATERWLTKAYERVRRVVGKVADRRPKGKPPTHAPSAEPEWEWKYKPTVEDSYEWPEDDEERAHLRASRRIDARADEERYRKQADDEAEITGDYSHIENEIEREAAEERWAERKVDREADEREDES